jgi:hypothetical protein
LISLDLSSCQVGDDGAVALATLIRLTSLELSSNEIGDAGVRALTALTALDLYDNRVGDAGAQAIATLHSLTTLHLAINPIGDRDVGALACKQHRDRAPDPGITAGVDRAATGQLAGGLVLRREVVRLGSSSDSRPGLSSLRAGNGGFG